VAAPYFCRGQWCREPGCEHVAGNPLAPAVPRDLHELFALLSPLGWVWSADYSGLWRRGHAAWVKSAGFAGRTEVHGEGLAYEGPLSGAVEYLRSKGLMPE
jgi:hypothetical protein